jgi:hypothetical protein
MDQFLHPRQEHSPILEFKKAARFPATKARLEGPLQLFPKSSTQILFVGILWEDDI